jgi:hypothetical protein
MCAISALARLPKQVEQLVDSGRGFLASLSGPFRLSEMYNMCQTCVTGGTTHRAFLVSPRIHWGRDHPFLGFLCTHYRQSRGRILNSRPWGSQSMHAEKVLYRISRMMSHGVLRIPPILFWGGHCFPHSVHLLRDFHEGLALVWHSGMLLAGSWGIEAYG